MVVKNAHQVKSYTALYSPSRRFLNRYRQSLTADLTRMEKTKGELTTSGIRLVLRRVGGRG